MSKTIRGSITYTTDLCSAPGNEHEIPYTVEIDQFGKYAYIHNIVGIRVSRGHFTDQEMDAIRRSILENLYEEGHIKDYQEDPGDKTI